jgi:hypothetical protein
MLFMGLVDLDQPYWLVGEHHFLHAQLNQVGGLWERAKKELAPVIPEATGWGKRGGGGHWWLPYWFDTQRISPSATRCDPSTVCLKKQV